MFDADREADALQAEVFFKKQVALFAMNRSRWRSIFRGICPPTCLRLNCTSIAAAGIHTISKN